MLKISGLFKDIEMIKSEKESADTEAIEHTFTSEAIAVRLEKKLETELDNEWIQCLQANSTLKELQEELEEPTHNHPVYRL